MKATNLLKEFELACVGAWQLSTRHSSTHHLKHLPGINFYVSLEFGSKKHVVYAFVIKGKVIYVGETSKGLNSRFAGYGYGNPNKRDTDNRIKKMITKSLTSNIAVSIWAATPVAVLKLHASEYEVPASKPVEEILIARLNPKLNKKKIGLMASRPSSPSHNSPGSNIFA
jgi:hypothetical protein